MKALEISGLCKVYDSGVSALSSISFDVAEGEFFGLLGPNGAGKTTTIGIVTSLVRKSGGKVRVFGIDIDEDFPSAKRLIGVVPQEFNFSVFEKVQDIVCQQAGYYGMSRKDALDRSEYYLVRLGLWDKRDTPARELSGGMKRRLMIARGLIHDPRLLILDEPTAGVDVELRRGMWDFLNELNHREGKTIILTTHYLEEAEQLCNRIAIINKGSIIENTDKRALLKKLDRETFVLDVSGPVSSLEPFDNAVVSILDDTSLEVILEKGHPLNELFAYLDRQGIVVESMRTKTNRLEEIFIEMVEG